VVAGAAAAASTARGAVSAAILAADTRLEGCDAGGSVAQQLTQAVDLAPQPRALRRGRRIATARPASARLRIRPRLHHHLTLELRHLLA
jgi:hypothetical protein